MKKAHIALIVSPKDKEIVAVPWLLEPEEPMHSGYIHEEREIMNHYHERWEAYSQMLRHAIPCDRIAALKVLSQQHPERKVLYHIRSHYNVTDITLAELLGQPKRKFIPGEKITCVYNAPLPGNSIGPDLVMGETYPLIAILNDSKGNPHFDVGKHSMHNYITSYETGEKLRDGERIHWCHPSRFM